MNGPYGTVKEFTVDPGCPWYEAQQTYGAPNVNWCEPTQCGYINEPANTWSNLPFLIFGILIFQKARKSLTSFFGVNVFLMGVFSFTYHASNNFLTQYIDFLGMFLVMSFLLTFATIRFFQKTWEDFYKLFWAFFSIHCVIFMIFDITLIPVQYIMALNALPVLFMEVGSSLRSGELLKIYYFWLGLAGMILAQGFAIMDIQRIYCNPENLWFHGHVMWHLISSLAMVAFAFHIQKHTPRKI